MNCDNCKHIQTCTRVWRNSKKECPHYAQMTNADHIRSMTDEELAEWICDATYKENEQGYPIMRTVNKVWWHKWLKQPYKEE